MHSLGAARQAQETRRRWPAPDSLRAICARSLHQRCRLLINEQSHRVAVQVPAASLMQDDGSIETRTRLVRPMLRETVTSTSLPARSGAPPTVLSSPRNGRPECDRVPEFSESSFHIITGLLLPIWTRLPSDTMRVYRFETEDGERVIGRVALLAWVTQAFEATPELSPGEAWTALLRWQDRSAARR